MRAIRRVVFTVTMALALVVTMAAPTMAAGIHREGVCLTANDGNGNHGADEVIIPFSVFAGAMQNGDAPFVQCHA